jgi:hypothetical protein
MKRRDALRSLALLTGGLVLVPSCNFSQEDILSAYTNLKITPSQKRLLAEIADTIIPAGQTKGAADIAVEDFILVMVNDCVNEQGQKSFTDGLQAFDAFSKNNSGKNFSALDAESKKAAVVQGLALEDEAQKHIKEFLSQTKRFTVQGFMASEYMQTEVKPYSLIPGKYQGAVLISDIKSERING